MNWRSLQSLALGMVFLLGLPYSVRGETDLRSDLSNLITRHQKNWAKKAKIGIAVSDAETGRELFNYQGEQEFIPASVLKIFTAYAALKILGSEYTFPTEILVHQLHSASATGGVDLYLRGYGDPSLVEEDLWKMAQEVKARGITQIRDLVIDDFLFLEQKTASGPRAYQAGASAVALKHNSYAVDIYPTKVGDVANVTITAGIPYQVVSEVRTVKGEIRGVTLREETIKSSSPLAVDTKGRVPFVLPRKRVVVSGKIGAAGKGQTIYRTISSGAAYCGTVFAALLAEKGVRIVGMVRHGQTPFEAKPLLIHRSEALKTILQDLNHFSNNFIAEQLVFILGQTGDSQFEHALGLQRIRDVVEKVTGHPLAKLFDGSGLDRDNRVRAGDLTRVLVEIYRDFAIAPDFISSLSRYGHSGTLKKRRLGDENGTGYDEIWAKTGTLNGVHSLVGYLGGRHGERLAFSLIINNYSSGEGAQKFEREFLLRLSGD